MFLHHTIAAERRKLGMTQETLADLAGITVRTVQRIENGQTIPRAHTARVLAHSLQLPLEDLYAKALPSSPETDAAHFLQILCFSCFSYLVLPWIHVLVPVYILKKRRELPAEIRATAQKIIRKQLYWTIALQGIMLLTVCFNLLQVVLSPTPVFIHYLIPVAVMYLFNGIWILRHAWVMRPPEISRPV